MMKDTDGTSSTDMLDRGLIEGWSKSESLDGKGRESRWKPSRMSYVQVIAAIIAFLIFASLERPEPPGWEPSTYEEWLYDEYYNASEMGYDTDVWGGRVIEDGQLGTLINLDPENLTVPVFVYDPVELTDEYIQTTLGRFFPEVDIDSFEVEFQKDREGTRCIAKLKNADYHITLERDGTIEFDYVRGRTPGDIIGSNESAKERALEYLSSSNALPEDIGCLTARCWKDYPRSGYVQYVVEIWKGNPYVDLYNGPSCNGIRFWFDGGAGRIVFFRYHWPEYSIPFLVTDLPTPQDMIEYHELVDVPAYNITYNVSDRILYMEASGVWKRGHSSADTYFWLPYRWIWRESPNYIMHDGDYYGAIFPDVIYFIK